MGVSYLNYLNYLPDPIILGVAGSAGEVRLVAVELSLFHPTLEI